MTPERIYERCCISIATLLSWSFTLEAKMEREYLTKVEVAERLKVNLATLYRWANNGCPMPTRRRRTGHGRPTLFTEAEVRAIEEWRDGVDE
jgi:hypothetical protein